MPRNTVSAGSRGVIVQIAGFQEFRTELAKLADDRRWSRELARTNSKLARQTIVPRMKRNAPVLDGHLRRSVRATQSPSHVSILIGNEGEVSYAGPINWGWPARNIRAQEFIYKSIVQEKENFKKEYWEAVTRLAKRAFPN